MLTTLRWRLAAWIANRRHEALTIDEMNHKAWLTQLRDP